MFQIDNPVPAPQVEGGAHSNSKEKRQAEETVPKMVDEYDYEFDGGNEPEIDKVETEIEIEEKKTETKRKRKRAMKESPPPFVSGICGKCGEVTTAAQEAEIILCDGAGCKKEVRETVHTNKLNRHTINLTQP